MMMASFFVIVVFYRSCKSNDKITYISKQTFIAALRTGDKYPDAAH